MFVHAQDNHITQVSVCMRKQFLIVLKIAAVTGSTVGFNGKSPAPVCLCVDRWALRGDHRLSGSNLMRPQEFERKIMFYQRCTLMNV